MANAKQLEILKQGVEAWNQWRKDHPDARINLRGAQLKGRDLSGANFRSADIRGARFKNAALTKADFTQAKTGYTLAGTCAQFGLAALYGYLTGWILVFAASVYADSLNLRKLLSDAITPGLLFVLSGASCLFTGSVLFGIRKGKAAGAGAGVGRMKS